MYSLLIVVAILGQTNHLDQLIKGLDSPSYVEREAAYKSLQKLEYQMIPRIKRELTENPSLEVRNACRSLIEWYYAPRHFNQLSIWYLPSKYRYQQHQDIAEEYYLVAYRNSGRNEDSEWFNYRISKLECEATMLLIEDMLNLGKRKECLEVLDCIDGNMKIMDNWDMNRGNFWRVYSNGSSKPNAIESVMIKTYYMMGFYQQSKQGIVPYNQTEHGE